MFNPFVVSDDGNKFELYGVQDDVNGLAEVARNTNLVDTSV